MPFRISIPPTAEPLHLDEVKAHLRIQHDGENDLLAGFLTSARQLWEEIAGRALVAQTVMVALPSFPCATNSYSDWMEGLGSIVLPRSPAIAVSSITYVDSNGDAQTVNSADYSVDTFMEPNRILLGYGRSWPTARRQPNAVQVIYTAGYATPFTVDASTDVVAFAGRAPVANERFRVWNSGGSLPGGLSVGTDYYAINVSGQTCKLSLTQGGSAVGIASSGAGNHYAGEIPRAILDELKLWVGERYENREQAVANAPKFILSSNYRLYGAIC